MYCYKTGFRPESCSLRFTLKYVSHFAVIAYRTISLENELCKLRCRNETGFDVKNLTMFFNFQPGFPNKLPNCFLLR